VILTDWAAVYVPAAGEKEGVAAGASIVYADEATALGEYPEAAAIALTVADAVNLNAAVYFVEAVVGVAPLVV
jgi:hypothetical protein